MPNWFDDPWDDHARMVAQITEYLANYSDDARATQEPAISPRHTVPTSRLNFNDVRVKGRSPSSDMEYRNPDQFTRQQQDRLQKLEQLLQEASAKIQEQQTKIQELSQAPWQTAMVTHVDKKHQAMRFMLEGSSFEAPLPTRRKIEVGDFLRLHPESGSVIDVSPLKNGTGEVCLVQKVHEDGMIEVDSAGTTMMVSKHSRIQEIEVGDRVLVVQNLFALERLGKAEEKFLFHGETKVSWDDIGGLQTEKELMIEALEMPYRYPEMFAAYGKKPTKGILLSGLPGNGKTLLAKAAATSIAKIHGHSASTGFISIKGPELLNMYVGNTEAAIRALFKMAREHKVLHGYPAVLFIDEADAVLGRRGGSTGVSSVISGTTVPQFLVEMDGMDESGCMVILATNRPDVLDGAVLRDGRIDHRIHINPPNREAAAQIVRLNLRNRPVATSTEQLAEAAVEGLFDPNRILYQITARGEQRSFHLSDAINGAMVTAVVETAVGSAFRRDREKRRAEGVRVEDIVMSVEHVFNEQKKIAHEEHLQDFTKGFSREVTGIRKVA